MFKALLTALFSILYWGVSAQEIDNTLSYRQLPSEHYFRVNYENDLFFGTDYYYTQGVHFELVNPRYKKSFLRHLFLKQKNTESLIGIGLESAGYTPTSIFADHILYRDRPFAGMAYLQAFSISIQQEIRSRLSSVLSLGLMGPAAGGYEIQAFIHRYTHNPGPIGWKFQLKNQIIVNYEMEYEKALTPSSNHFLITTIGMARFGTYSTKAGVGLAFMAGIFQDPFKIPVKNKKIFGYAYFHPQVELVGYDATLQGGLFTKDNPYTIPNADITRVVLRSQFGLIVSKGKWTVGLNSHYL
ncbi:MAG: lipid A deacylase LpxR family protein, partial [Chitinophagaceae bacterium]